METHHDHHRHGSHEASDDFPTDPTGLPESAPTDVVDLADGDALELRIAPVAKRLGDATVRMLAYNGSVPGPTLRVREGSQVVVDVANDGDLDATVHWHGLRLDNRYDGTHETQGPIPVDGTFTYRLDFPDPGVYWYHPHIREDYGQELGLYGNILVVPAEDDYWPPAHRELTLTLDDVLIEDGKIAPFGAETTYAAMGRFGNVMLVNGETDLSLGAQPGEVVRLYLTNTANTRVFNVALPGARMKLVGGDSGRSEHEQLVESVIVAPSERVVVDVLFDTLGEVALEHRTPERKYTLATFGVAGDSATPLDEGFETLRHNTEWIEERERLQAYFDAPPDKTLAFVAELDLGDPGEAAVYTCPMHPDIVSDEPGNCPTCGMKLLPAGLVASAGHGGHAEDHGHQHGQGHGHHHTRREGRGAAWNRVGRRHGRRQSHHDVREHALEARRQGHRRRESRHRLALPRRRPRQAAARQRARLRPPDAPSVPRARRRPLRRAHPRRRARAEPRVEGHRARAHRRDRRHPARRHEPRHLDGPLPHRRAPRERDDAQLHGRSCRPLTRPATSLLALCFAAVALTAVPGAHAHGGTRSSGYVSSFSSLEPSVLGVLVNVFGSHNTIQLSNYSSKPVVVFGREGEPYLRFTRAGVSENMRSPTTFLNRSEVVPPDANPGARPAVAEGRRRKRVRVARPPDRVDGSRRAADRRAGAGRLASDLPVVAPCDRRREAVPDQGLSRLGAAAQAAGQRQERLGLRGSARGRRARGCGRSRSRP